MTLTSFETTTRVQNKSIILTVPAKKAKMENIQPGWYVRVILEPIKKVGEEIDKLGTYYNLAILSRLRLILKSCEG